MRFLIKQTGASSERVGSLTNFSKLANTNIETPTAALFTKSSSVVHLTGEVLSKVFTSSQLLWVPLSNSAHLEPGLKAQGEGVAKFAALPHHVTCLAVNDLTDVAPSGHFEADYVPLWTRNGKKKINADRYMDLVEVFKPDIILAIADGRTSLSEPHKRIRKSVERTCYMLDICVKRYKDSKELQGSGFIGVLVGVSHPKECDNCLRRLLVHKDSLSGIALSGLTDGTDNSIDVTVEQLLPILQKIDAALPKHLLRIIEGTWNPAVIVSAIEYGWDVFDGSYPLKLTNSGLAMKFNLDSNSENDCGEMCIIDLKDKRYKDDFGPLSPSCECLACKNHTRAYVNHLLNTKEMLAPVLLNIHNLSNYDEMFRRARQHIQGNTFQQFKKSIIDQYELYRNAQEEKDEEGENDQAVQPSKKKRLSNGDTSNTDSLNGMAMSVD